MKGWGPLFQGVPQPRTSKPVSPATGPSGSPSTLQCGRCGLGAVAGAPGTAVPASPSCLPEKTQGRAGLCVAPTLLNAVQASRILRPAPVTWRVTERQSFCWTVDGEGLPPLCQHAAGRRRNHAALSPLSTLPGCPRRPAQARPSSLATQGTPRSSGSFSDRCCFPTSASCRPPCPPRGPASL